MRHLKGPPPTPINHWVTSLKDRQEVELEYMGRKTDGCYTGMLWSSSASGLAKMSTSLHLNNREISLSRADV